MLSEEILEGPSIQELWLDALTLNLRAVAREDSPGLSVVSAGVELAYFPTAHGPIAPARLRRTF